MVLRVSQLVKEHRVRRWIGKWRKFTALQIRRRKEKQTFPACPSRKIFGQQISSLKSKGESTSSPLKRKSLVQQSACVKRFNSLSGNFKLYSLRFDYFIYKFLYFIKISNSM